MRVAHVLETIAQDLHQAYRGLRRTPALALVALGTLALAIGANAAVFTFLNSLLLRELPVRNPHSLIQISVVTRRNPEAGISLRMLQEFARTTRSVSAVTGWRGPRVLNVEVGRMLGTGGVWSVTGNFYSELGVEPVAGRLLTDADADLLHPAPVAVLGYVFWERQYARDPGVVGNSIRLEGVPFTVIGVAPRGLTGFELIMEPDVTIPLTAEAILINRQSREAVLASPALSIRTVGRMKAGVTVERARADLTASWPAIREVALPPTYTGTRREEYLSNTLLVRSAARGYEPAFRKRFQQPAMVVLGVALLMLLIATINLASLMLVRGVSRNQEIALRIALGSSRWRIARQIVLEGLLLSGLGACAGVILAQWVSRALGAVVLQDYLVSTALDLTPDRRVILFTAALAAGVGSLFSIPAAARAMRRDPATLLHGVGRTLVGAGRIGVGLVVLQVALSLALLVDAGLLIRTIQHVRSIDTGWSGDGVLVAFPQPRPGGYAGVANDSYYPVLLQRISTIPGVRVSSISLYKPASGGDSSGETVSAAGSARGVSSVVVTPVAPNFFAALGIPVLGGRDFAWSDNASGRRVAIVSRSLAQRLFPNEDAIGQHLRIGSAPPAEEIEIVGVAGDSRLYDIKSDNVLGVYVPALQQGDRANAKALIIRASHVSLDALRTAVSSLGRENLMAVQSLDEINDGALLNERLAAMVARYFGALALILAAIGLYGLLSYVVSQRRREIAVRLTLGQSPRAVVWSVVATALGITGLGLIIGLPVAYLLAQLVRPLLFDVQPSDPTTLMASSCLLLIVALAACLLPAARAARVDPMVLLREE